MSDPEPTQPAPPEPPARWLDRATGLLLCVAVGIALGPATPALLRAVGAPLPGLGERSEGPPIALPHQPPELLADPDALFDPDHDLDPEEAQAQLPDGRIGLARGPLTLHDKPAPTARPLGDVKAGELVMIMRESGDWVYVVHGGEDRMVSGWAKKSEIAVR
jgi:hypothetical protein